GSGRTGGRSSGRPRGRPRGVDRTVRLHRPGALERTGGRGGDVGRNGVRGVPGGGRVPRVGRLLGVRFRPRRALRQRLRRCTGRHVTPPLVNRSPFIGQKRS